MSSDRDYRIIRNTVPKELAEKVGEALLPQRHYAKEKYLSYVLPPSCDEITRAFQTDENKNILTQLFHPNTDIDHVFAGKFRKTSSQPKKTAAEDEIYVTIALTKLSPDNGWYMFYEGSRSKFPIPDEKKIVQMTLEAGDAVIWRGDIVYLHSLGGGGMFQTIVYRLPNKIS